MRKDALMAGLAAASLALSPSAAGAQAVDGVVLDALSGHPLAGATIVLLDSAGAEVSRTRCTDVGRFFLRAPEPGVYRVWGDVMGYDAVLSEPLVVGASFVPVEIRLTPLPIVIEGVRVIAEARRLALERTGYYQRRRRGIGSYVDLEEIERAVPVRTTDLLQMQPSVRLLPDVDAFGGTGVVAVFRDTRRGLRAGGGLPCLPTLVLDGTAVRRGGGGGIRLDELVHPAEILAMELYPSGVGVPARWSGPDARSGVIIVWTKQRIP